MGVDIFLPSFTLDVLVSMVPNLWFLINWQTDVKEEDQFFNSTDIMDEYCREKKFVGWFETSAKESTGIDEAMRTLVHKVSIIIG